LSFNQIDTLMYVQRVVITYLPRLYKTIDSYPLVSVLKSDHALFENDSKVSVQRQLSNGTSYLDKFCLCTEQMISECHNVLYVEKKLLHSFYHYGSGTVIQRLCWQCLFCSLLFTERKNIQRRSLFDR